VLSYTRFGAAKGLPASLQFSFPIYPVKAQAQQSASSPIMSPFQAGFSQMIAKSENIALSAITASSMV
jgi:hypothetical protein